MSYFSSMGDCFAQIHICFHSGATPTNTRRSAEASMCEDFFRDFAFHSVLKSIV